MKAYIHKDGFARFCSVKYKAAAEGFDDLFVHLTNVSLQKSSTTYNDVHGGKWHFQNLITFIESTRGLDAAQQLVDDINWIFIQVALLFVPVKKNLLLKRGNSGRMQMKMKMKMTARRWQKIRQ